MSLIEEKLERYGCKPGLERIAKIMDALGNPQKKLRVIMVGGTNGKGSTAAYISSILKEEGYRVGTFISPHTVAPNERFQVNGKWIDAERLAKYEKEMIALHEKGFEMTLWEAYAAIAYRYCADEKVDFAVIEVMMGGKYDATNIADANISVITNVALDHTEFLGDTVEKIAAEKAGIIKKGVAITGAAEAGYGIISMHAKNTGIPLKGLGRDFFSEIKELTAEGTVFDYVGMDAYIGLKTPLAGDHQAFNAALAVAVAEELGIGGEAIRAGLLNARHPGRLEMVNREPRILADAAHNPDGIGSLVASLNLYDYDKLIVVFGAKKTKDWMKMVELIAPQASFFIATKVDDRSVDPKELADKAATFTKTAVDGSIKDALKRAIGKCGEKDMVLVCGSIYLLQELYKLKGAVRR
ncbi:bifunctional folylpolyglutamate synthase/dihydrofolate synthase [Candidatus Micrarchaeota archaeon]|nr:bifunctional folylpolyglutamate synthase/dihydrofolate synthase [Candidatus Micrarchaeota archaeon]